MGEGRLFETIAVGSGFGPLEGTCTSRLLFEGGEPNAIEVLLT